MQKPNIQGTQSGGESVGSRALLGATVAYTLLSVTALAVLGTTPAAADPGEQVVAWFSGHSEAVRWSVWASTVSTPLYALIVAMLRRLLPAPHRDVYFIGAVLLLVTATVYEWTWAGLALHADRLDPATARALLDIAIFFGPVLTGTTITMMAPVTLLALQERVGLPRWLGVWGVIAIVEQAVETVTIFGSKGFTQPGGAMNWQLGAGLTLGWMLAFAFWGGFRGRQPASRRLDTGDIEPVAAIVN
jgi:hypothetical protein